MNDFNTMLREQARNGLQAQLDAAVTNGDTEAARKVTGELEKLAITTAPKQPAFVDADIRAILDKQPWFGTDPKKSGKAAEIGRNLDPKKFASAELFADAIVKAVDAEFPPPAPPKKEGEEENGENEGEGEKEKAVAASARKRSDAPGDGDAGGARAPRTPSGPWTKLSDAPNDVRKEITRTADKFAPKTKEGRESYIAKALDAHYNSHQRNKAKK